jgi:hypothetical protein
MKQPPIGGGARDWPRSRRTMMLRWLHREADNGRRRGGNARSRRRGLLRRGSASETLLEPRRPRRRHASQIAGELRVLKANNLNTRETGANADGARLPAGFGNILSTSGPWTCGTGRETPSFPAPSPAPANLRAPADRPSSASQGLFVKRLTSSGGCVSPKRERKPAAARAQGGDECVRVIVRETQLCVDQFLGRCSGLWDGSPRGRGVSSCSRWV